MSKEKFLVEEILLRRQSTEECQENLLEEEMFPESQSTVQDGERGGEGVSWVGEHCDTIVTKHIEEHLGATGVGSDQSAGVHQAAAGDI